MVYSEENGILSQEEIVDDILWNGTAEEIANLGRFHSGFLRYKYSDVGEGYFTIWFYSTITRGYGVDPLPNCVRYFGSEYSF